MNPVTPRVLCQLRYESCGAPLHGCGMVDLNAKLLHPAASFSSGSTEHP